MSSLAVDMISCVPLSENHFSITAYEESSGAPEAGESTTSKDHLGAKKLESVAGTTAKNSIIGLEEPVGEPYSLAGSVLEKAPDSGDELEKEKSPVLLTSVGDQPDLKLEKDPWPEGGPGSENILESQCIQKVGGVDEPGSSLESGQLLESHQCAQYGIVEVSVGAQLLGSGLESQDGMDPRSVFESEAGPKSVGELVPFEATHYDCATASLGVPESSDALEPISVIEFRENVGYGGSTKSPGMQEHSDDSLSDCTIQTLSGTESTGVVDSRNSHLIADVRDSETLAKSVLDLGLIGFTDQKSLVLSADLAVSLCCHAAPKGKSEEEKYSDPAVPKRAIASGTIMVDLLKAMHKGSPEYENSGASFTFSEEEGQAPCTLPSALAASIYIFASTHREHKTWTDKESRAKAEEVFTRLLWASHTGSVAELLRGCREADRGIFRDVMGLLKPELKKDTWELNPATKYVFSSTLHQVTRPWLSDYLDSVLPPSLLISDDYRTDNKILGVRCLHHIILNVPAAELLQHNRAQVVYHALYNHLYTPDADLIQVVLPCLLDLLPVLERFSHARRDSCQRHQHTNDVLQLILTHMEMEHKILLRRVYANHLPAFVERLGIGVARHLKRLERVLVGYIEVYDGPEETARLSSLSTLKCIIKHAWPRMPCRLGALLKSLLRLLYDVATDCSLTPGQVKSSLLEEATDCLILLDRCSERQVKVLLKGISNTCTDQQVLKYLAKVQQDV